MMPGRTCQNVSVAICDLQPRPGIEAYVSDINDDAKYVSLYQSFSFVWGDDTIKIISVSGVGVQVCHTFP